MLIKNFLKDTTEPDKILSKTFEEVAGYDEMVVIRDIRLESHCEHHMVPILGKAHVAYIPDKRVVGISKLARVVDCYAKKITNTRDNDCSNCRMYSKSFITKRSCSSRRCRTPMYDYKRCTQIHTSTVTSRMLGLFRTDARTRMEFMNFIGKN